MKQIPLTKGRVALIDDDDFDRVIAAGSWHASKASRTNWYAAHADGRRTIRLHTFLTGWPLVDHINGDGLDNRRANLRPATGKQNAANMRTPAHNTSGFKGVTYYRRTGRWRAHLTTDGRQRHLGYFDTAEEAAYAYDTEAIGTWGEYARTNFPREDHAA
jgi:hypothetical protein